MKDEYSPPQSEAHIDDYELDDLPLETIEEDEEISQISQSDPYQEFGEGEEWIAAALATIRVREAIARITAGPEKVEQERTRRKKEIFIQAYEETMGSIGKSSTRAGIDRRTYYQWMSDDNRFRSEITTLDINLLDSVEDKLKDSIDKNDATSIRYFLDRKHPAYKPKGSLEVIDGHRTFEDMLYESAMETKMAMMPVKAEVIAIEGKKEHGNNKRKSTAKEPAVVQA